MTRLAAIVAFLCMLIPAPASSESAVLFGGETYIKQHENDSDHVRVARFVRPNEDLHSWTRLIAISHHPRLMNPLWAAENLGRKMQEENPGIAYRVSSRNNGAEAIIEITESHGDGSPAEFHAYRFMKQSGYSGLLSYHYATRILDTLADHAGSISKNREKWVGELVGVNFGHRFDRLGEEAFAQKP